MLKKNPLRRRGEDGFVRIGVYMSLGVFLLVCMLTAAPYVLAAVVVGGIILGAVRRHQALDKHIT